MLNARVAEVAALEEAFDRGLHDLSQPLTALQCRLYLGTTETEPGAMEEALRESLIECERVLRKMREWQERVQALRTARE